MNNLMESYRDMNKMLSTADDFFTGKADEATTKQKFSEEFDDVMKKGNLPEVLEELRIFTQVPAMMHELPGFGGLFGRSAFANYINAEAGKYGDSGVIEFFPGPIEKNVDQSKEIAIRLDGNHKGTILTYPQPEVMPVIPANVAPDSPNEHDAYGLPKLELDEKTARFVGPSGAGNKAIFELENPEDVKKIETLNLQDFGINNKGLSNLKKYSNLRDLNLEGNMIDSEGLKILAGLPNLERLGLRFDFALENDGLKEIAKFPRLKSLNISDTRVSADGIAELKNMPLERLVMSFIDNPADSDKAAKIVSEMPNLKELDWLDGRLTDSGIESLSHSNSIEFLNLKSNVNLTSKSLESLSRMQGLKSLNLIEVVGITEKDVAELKRKLPNTEILYWNDAQLFGIH